MAFRETTKSPPEDAAARPAGGSLSALRDRLFSFPAVMVAALCFLVYIVARRNIADPDLWWHLRNAQFLLTQHHLPVTDHYSYTAPGAPVMPFEWLSELPYYVAYKWAGLTGVFWLVFALCTAIALGIFRLSFLASRDVKNSLVASVGGVFLTTVSMGARTLLFGWLFLVILLLILAEVREGHGKWLWLLPPLFCLWINSHGSWPMGLLLFGIFIASGFFEGSWGYAYATRWSASQLRQLLMAAGASAVAVFLNPLGFRLVRYPFHVMFQPGSGSGSGSGAIGYIEEFKSVNFHTPWGKVAMVLILALLLVAIFSRVRWRLDELGFTIVAVYYCLTYVRFLFLAGILLSPVFARRVKLMMPYRREADRALRNAIALAVLFVLFLVNPPGHKNPGNAKPGDAQFDGVVDYPQGAMAYMKANGIDSHVFHEWVWGGYLLWYDPALKVFIDGRGDPYAATGVYGDYLKASNGLNAQTLLDKYKVQYVLMQRDSLLVQVLQNTPGWSVLYSDKDSVLLARSLNS